jgi:hypothetical protein
MECPAGATEAKNASERRPHRVAGVVPFGEYGWKAAGPLPATGLIETGPSIQGEWVAGQPPFGPLPAYASGEENVYSIPSQTRGTTMASLFRNALHQDFGTWPLGYIPYGGADFGEVRAVAEAIGDGDDAAYYDAWNAAADRLKAEADTAIAKGHAASARALYLRASAFYATVIVRMFGITAEAAKDLGALDESLIERLDTYIRGDRQLRWKVIQRGFWVHGVDDLRSYLASAELFTMQGHAERIRCPTLITSRRYTARKHCCTSPPRKAPTATARCRTDRFSISGSLTGSTNSLDRWGSLFSANPATHGNHAETGTNAANPMSTFGGRSRVMNRQAWVESSSRLNETAHPGGPSLLAPSGEREAGRSRNSALKPRCTAARHRRAYRASYRACAGRA